MIVSQIPTRSVVGMAALDVFYQEFNDVAFYVEDADQENLYHTILSKHFPDVRISRIFPLGGKSNVLAHARDKSNKLSSTKRVYILDKDFDDLLKKKARLKNTFYLDRFCIENHLIDLDAIVELVVESTPKTKRTEIEARLQLVDFERNLNEQLRPLFALFFCSQLFELGLRNCSAKPEEYCNARRLWTTNAAKVSLYQQQLIVAAHEKQVNPPLLDPLNDDRVNVITSCTPESVISGKFKLAMIFHYVKSHYSLGSITFDSFVYRVAKNSSITSLEGLTNKIKKYINEGILGGLSIT